MSAERPRLVVGNWKMNLSEIWAVELIDSLLPRIDEREVEVAVAPAFPCLRAVCDRLSGSDVRLAAQNLHWEDRGAFTGEVSPRMLREIGVAMVIVGHSERRALFSDTDERIRKKVGAARRHDLVPILCVGEQEAERDDGLTLEIVERQLRIGLSDVKIASGRDLVVAYEPVWAIGTGRTATPAQVDEVHRMLREQLGTIFGAAIAASVRILYGGSVTPDNAGELFALDEVDGALVGGASLDAEKFSAIVHA